MFNILIGNQSDSSNSFKAVLEIEYVRDDNSVSRVFIEHMPDISNQISRSDIKVYEKNVRLDERSTATNWFLFEQPKEIFDKYKIEKYIIKITDVYENSKQLEAFIIKNISPEIQTD